MNSQIHIHTGYNKRITHKLNMGVGEKKTHQKKERKSTNKKAKTEQIQQEHQYKGDIIFLGCRVAHILGTA